MTDGRPRSSFAGRFRGRQSGLAHCAASGFAERLTPSSRVGGFLTLAAVSLSASS